MRKPKLPTGQDNPDDEVVEEETTRDLNFTINDGTNAIQDATVTIGTKTSSATGSQGGCSLTGITDGEHSITVECEGYTTKTETITVSENNTNFTISLTAIGDG